MKDLIISAMLYIWDLIKEITLCVVGIAVALLGLLIAVRVGMGFLKGGRHSPK